MNPLLLRTGGLLLAAGLGALLAPPLEPAPAEATARQDAWTPPALPRKPDQAAQALALVSSPLFEPEAKTAAAQTAATAPPPDERWRVAGLLGRGSERRALISYADPAKPAETLKVGDKLPSGHRIHRIDDGAVCVQVGRKILRIGVQTRD